MKIRKILITWSKYRNTIGYPISFLLCGLRFGHLPGYWLGPAIAISFCVLFVFNSIVRLIESVVMRLRGYRFINLLGDGAFWRHKSNIKDYNIVSGHKYRDRYVLVYIDGHSNSNLD